MRYNPTERKGVNATEGIFINEFEWIFREQPIVDVGIDALVEESVDGNPTGKFIALQIKSGKGNFYTSQDNLTYYISVIHYYYWLNFDIPVLLIAHIPESNETYWVEISERSIVKNDKNYKINIPFNNKLNRKAKLRIVDVLTVKRLEYQTIKIFRGEKIEDQTIFDIIEKAQCVNDALESVFKMDLVVEELGLTLKNSAEKLFNLAYMEELAKKHILSAVADSFAKRLNIHSKRLENECQIFSETIAVGFFAYEQILMVKNLIDKDNKKQFEQMVDLISKTYKKLNITIEGIHFFKRHFSMLPTDFDSIKNAKITLTSVIDFVQKEFEIGRSIVKNLKDKIEEKMNANS